MRFNEDELRRSDNYAVPENQEALVGVLREIRNLLFFIARAVRQMR